MQTNHSRSGLIQLFWKSHRVPSEFHRPLLVSSPANYHEMLMFQLLLHESFINSYLLVKQG